MELHPFGIGVSIVYPPNTDTEGFAVEQQEMPEEVKAISGTAGLFSAKRVAQKAIDNIESGGYASTMGKPSLFDLFLLLISRFRRLDVGSCNSRSFS